MTTLEQAKYKRDDIQEAMSLAIDDERWRDVAKYAEQLADVSEVIACLQWAKTKLF
jgi:hypothetical protein